MSIKRPFKRTLRPNIQGDFVTNYVFDNDYAKNAGQYIKAYLIILKDFEKILEFIEPCNLNMNCYSMRIQELLFRSCVEIEANFTAILFENNYRKKWNWKMEDYIKTNKTHFLSDYKVMLPYWKEREKIFYPFSSFRDGKSPEWYKAYNDTKHSKYTKFEQANLEHLVNCIAGLTVLISSQFFLHDLNKKDQLWISGELDSFFPTIGNIFTIKYPNYPKEELYDFDWNNIQIKDSKFDILNFS